MPQIFRIRNNFQNIEKSTNFFALSTKAMMGIFLFLAFVFSGTVSAQNVSQSKLNCPSGHCTSNDLQIVSVAIDAPACATCTPGQTVTYPLKMTIHNGTKSVRTSFALYGTLSSGATINGISGNIFVCVGPITVKSDQLLPGETAPGNQTFAVGSITFTCGQTLTLTNNFLAWTDASGTTSDRCTKFSNATQCSDIEPKCGTASSITIVGPVVAPTLAKTDPTCTTSTGCVTVISSTTGFTFSFNGGAYAPYPSGGWCGLTEKTEYCVTSKRTSDGCVSPQACVTIGTAPANPARPVVTLQEATICGTVTTPSITVSCPIVGTYKLTQPGQTDQTFSYTGSNGPVKLTVKPGIGFSITVTTAAGCTSAATNCTNYTTNSCPAGRPSQVVAAPNIKKALTLVKAAPNPFNDEVKFTLQSGVSGQGSLDLYNMLGQKVKTVYQGYIEKGKVQTIEYSVPNAQRTNLIYMFRVGNQRTTGKLVGLK